MEYYGTKEFATKKELFIFLSDNRDMLVAQKKAAMKKADCPVFVAPVIVNERKPKSASKADGLAVDITAKESLKAVCIINTTNFLDSHGDLHIPGLWTRSLQQNKMIMHLQEHEMEFDKIIADGSELKAYTKKYTWSELGYPYEGDTEALVFESNILRKRNEFMIDQYANGWVKNHSVGMYYVKMDLALNDEGYVNEYEAWKKYYPQIGNKEVADERGYFWYVLEAKCVEGSAVPLGSNTATPTLSIDKGAVVCPECDYEFEYNSVTESGMGYVNCPKCEKPVTEACKPKGDPGLDPTHNISDPVNTTQSKAINFNYLTEKFKLQ